MYRITVLILTIVFWAVGLCTMASGQKFETDTFHTSGGDLKITFIGHSSLIFSFKGKIIHVDPYGRLADYGKLPKADMVLITHEHYDHLDPDALAQVIKDDTVIVANEAAAKKLKNAVIMKNGDMETIVGLTIRAVPAYNIVHKRSDGTPFHPKGVGNGYVITFGDKRVYIAGDTENIPEMAGLEKIDIAFLPMNLPYTMTPEMVAKAAKSFKPEILYPYHMGETNPGKIVKLLEGSGIEVRIRRMR